MKREIKFRAWARVRMLNHGNLLAMTKLIGDVEGVFLPFADDVDLMQYTGRRDIDGKEIYEGDVIEYADWRDRSRLRGSVQWSNESAWWAVYDSGGDFMDGLNRCESPRVIGNIYENPGLLEAA